MKKNKNKIIVSLISTIAFVPVIVTPIALISKNNLNNANQEYLNNNENIETKNNPINNSSNTIINPINDIGFYDILPQTFYRGKYLNDLQPRLLSYISQPTNIPNVHKMTTNDYSIVTYEENSNKLSPHDGPYTFSNTDGWLSLTLRFKPGTFYENGQLNTKPVDKNITINGGFLTLKPTSRKSINPNEPVIIDTLHSPENNKRYASTISKWEIIDLINQPENLKKIVNNPVLFSDQQLDLNSQANFMNSHFVGNNGYIEITPNNDNGTIKVHAKLLEYQGSREIQWDFGFIDFTIGGYFAKDNPNDSKFFTTTCKNEITINSLNNIIASDCIVNNELTDDIKNKIINYIVANPQEVFNYLDPNASAINANDLEINLNHDIETNINNAQGNINVNISLKNNKAWTNGVANNLKEFKNINICGFKNVEPTSVKNNILDVSKNNQLNNKWTYDVTLDEISNFLNENKDDIFNNLPSNAKIIIDPSSFNNNSNVADGKITLRVTTSSYFDEYNSALVNKQWKYIDLTITGFKKSDQKDTIINNFDIKWPYTLAQNAVENVWINELKTEILKNIKNPPYSQHNLTINDFNINVENSLNGYNNINGTLNVNLTFNPKTIYLNGQLNTNPYQKQISISGFLKLNQTTIKQNINIVDDLNVSSTKKVYASDITINQLEKLANNKIDELVNNPINLNETEIKNNPWVKNTTIDLSNATLNINNQNGTINVINAQLKSYENSYQITNEPLSFNFIVSGYLSNKNDPKYFNTTMNNELEINTLNGIIAQDAIKSTNELTDQVKNIIIDYLVNNQKNIFSYLNPQATEITKSDLNISLSNKNEPFNNKDGYLYIDVSLSNQKAWENGIICDKQPKVFKNIKVNGFKKISPTTLIKTSYTVNSEWSNKNTNEMSFEQATNFLNENKKEIFSSLPPDAKIIIDKNSFNNENIADGYITLKIATSSYYDTPNATYHNKQSQELYDFQINGFKSYKQKDTLFNNFDIKWPQTLAQSIVNGQWKDELKQEILKNIKNPEFSQHVLMPDDFNVTIENSPNGYNNIDGTLFVDLTFNPETIYINNGHLNNQSYTTKIKISGFMKLNKTTIKNQSIVDDLNNLKNKIFANDANIQSLETLANNKINELLNNPIQWKNESEINNNKDIKNTYISLKNAHLEIDNNTGTINVSNAEVLSYQNDWQVSNQPLSINFSITGYLSLNDPNDSKYFTTTVVDKINIKNVNNILAQDATLGSNWGNIKNLILNELKQNNNIKYLANGKPLSSLTNNDIEISCDPKNNEQDKNIIGSDVYWNNLDGTLIVNVIIKNNNAWTNGKIDQSKCFKLIVEGFKTQHPTTINDEINLNNVSNLLPISIQINQLENLLNDKEVINQIGTNLPPNAFIKVNQIINNDKSLTDNGKIKASISISPIIDEKGNLITNQPMQKDIIVGGFLKSSNINTTVKNNIIDINANNILPFDLMNLNKEDVELNKIITLIKQYIVDHQDQIFENLNPNSKLTIDDIKIETFSNPINKNGTIILNEIIINGNKVLIGGQPLTNEYKFDNNGNGFIITGFKKQQPTEWENLDPSDSSKGIIKNLDGIQNLTYNKINNEQLTNIINQPNNINKFLKNLPPDAKVTAEIIPNGINPSNGTVTCKISASNSYDQNGNPNGNIYKEYKIFGFKKIIATTTINNIILNDYNNVIASEVYNNNIDQNQCIKDIKKAIINQNAINNYNPQFNKINENDFDINIVGYKNKDGILIVNVILKNDLYMQNGIIVPPPRDGIQIYVKGFARLIPTNISNIVVSPDLGNKTIEDISSQKEILEAVIAQQVCIYVNSIDQGMMFPPKELNVNDITNIRGIYLDTKNGSLQATITINRNWVNESGEIMPGPHDFKVKLSGFKTSNQSNWINDNWWIIVVSIVGAALVILIIVLLINKIKDRNNYLYGY